MLWITAISGDVISRHLIKEFLKLISGGCFLMKKYDGLEAYKIPVDNGAFIYASNCLAIITLELVDGVCVTDKDYQQIEYVGDQG